MTTDIIKIDNPNSVNLIIGQSHFIMKHRDQDLSENREPLRQ
ncbi:MAG: hypothetical protein UV17_C0061G0009 [Candidatus Gottesmanbacteria bacterium GW2011_GWA1_42_26]|nr:MAG: hypothetical protein UV17_C0061G0009 [Candidatus Gottesmanbacteria bacterium GW2011_GWA1_42_26]